MKHILIVEDDRALSNGIRIALKQEEYVFEQANTLLMAREFLKNNIFDLIILDINLPDGNGLDFLQELRKKSETAVIILTANDLETDIVTGFELGADDYITKPFSLMVLQARVNARLKDKKSENGKKYQSGDFVFSFETMEFSKGNQSIELSKTEQKLLKLLVENKGNTLTRNTLLDRVWSDGAEYVDENALSVAVKRLRDKLEGDCTHPKYIQTVYGLGYKWEEP